MGNAACTENSKGKVSSYWNICVPFVNAFVEEYNCTYASVTTLWCGIQAVNLPYFVTFQCASWKLINLICISSKYFSISLILFDTFSFFTGGFVSSWLSSVKENVEKTNFLYVPRVLIYFSERLDMFFHSLGIKLWRRQNDIHPCIAREQIIKIHTAAGETVSEQDHIHACIKRLQRLEKAFEELSHKPASIPLEKEKILMGSLDRIKSVELDLEQTKRVSLYTLFNHLILLIVLMIWCL